MNRMRMPLLDVAFQLLDGAHSPQDFTLIFDLRDPPDSASLCAGARSAMNRFPTSGSCIQGHRWVWRDVKQFPLDIVNTVADSHISSAIEKFIDGPFDIRRQLPVRQLLINGTRLVTRFHHAAADGLSAALWLGHQLNVAYGFEAAQLERAQFNGLALRRLQTSVRRSKFAFDGASDPLWTSNFTRSGARRWLTINFPSCCLQEACRRVGGFTYSDLLATCTLEVFLRWNSQHDGNRKIGLWLPMNVRSASNSGFGNGTSRIRLYARYNAEATLVEKAREVRRQVSWTSKHGEWVVPEIPWFTRLPRSIAGPFLRRYLNLSSVDMATGVFSHAGSWMANAPEAFRHVERIECVGLLHPRQNLAVNAATHCGQTWLTLAYDPQMLNADDAQQLAELYNQQIALAQRELV